MMERYQVYPDSVSAHCCFEATVVDTLKPQMIGGTHYKDSRGELQYEGVCECINAEDARLVCKALNATIQSGATPEVHTVE